MILVLYLFSASRMRNVDTRKPFPKVIMHEPLSIWQIFLVHPGESVTLRLAEVIPYPSGGVRAMRHPELPAAL